MRPKFSVIIAARNDNYNDQFSDRWLVCLYSIAHAASKIGNLVEYIVVDYGSDKLNKKWLDENYLSSCPDNIKIKFVRVPYDLLKHKRFGNPPYLDVIRNKKNYETIEHNWGDNKVGESDFFHSAIFNVGLKHVAEGKYVISTCADDFFSQDFFKHLLSAVQLQENKKDLFICTRVNILKEDHKDITYNDNLTFSERREQLNKLLLRENFQPRKEDILSNYYQGAVGDFQMMKYECWLELKGYMEYLIHWGYADVNLCERTIFKKYGLINLYEYYHRPFFYHLGHDINENRVINLHTYYIGRENPDDWGDYKGEIKVITNYD